MKILIVIADLGLGGAQQVVINLANELSKRGHKIYIFDVYPYLRKSGMTNRFDKGVKLITKNYCVKPKNIIEKAINSFLFRLKIETNYIQNKRENAHIKNLNKCLHQVEFDIVNSHIWWADYFVYKQLKGYHHQWFITLHGSYSQMLKETSIDSFFVNKACNVLNTAKGVIYLSEEELLNIKNNIEFQQTNFRKIHNGIPKPEINNKLKRAYLKLENDDFIILCASRAIKEKGWEELIESAILLSQEKHNVKLLLAGDGPMLSYWKTRYKAFECIKFIGYRDDILELINIVNIVALLSYSEALPTILIESVFMNKPIIATNSGDTKHILIQKEHKSGVLLPPKPKLEEIKNSILHLMEDSNYADYLKGCAKIKDSFKISKMVNDYVEFFNE